MDYNWVFPYFKGISFITPFRFLTEGHLVQVIKKWKVAKFIYILKTLNWRNCTYSLHVTFVKIHNTAK